MKKQLVFIFSLMLLPAAVFAYVHETLPSWHWAYEAVDELRLRGGFGELFSLSRPYTRGDVAEALIAIRKNEVENRLAFTPEDKRLYLRLVGEFMPEVEEIQGKADPALTVRLGARLAGGVNGSGETDAEYKGVYRTKTAVPLGKWGCAYNGTAFDQYKLDDPGYIGKRWRHITAYEEQAYVSARLNRLRLKFGRDFLRWGTGRSGTLLFSDICRPLDQFSASFDLGPLRYGFMASQLDPHSIDRGMTDSLGDGLTRRFLSAHRLDVKLFGGRLQAGISEAILYGGPNRQFDWIYLNPAVFYHGEQLNVKEEGNTLGMIDVLCFPVPRWEISGSVLIDDIQVERTGPGDLEPAEWGMTLGTRIADPFAVPGLTLFGEYARVTNRTYKTARPWETFIHRNAAMGHPLGNDFDLWRIGFIKWVEGNIRLEVHYGRVRKGEGSLFAPFDTPWEDTPAGQTYTEPFPTGTVETRSEIGGSVFYHPVPSVGIEAEFASAGSRNALHVKGATGSGTFWRIGIWFDGDVFVRFKK